ncbi:MAG TPA: DNA cytosine methyltransferase [Blastocatellia bacterium]|nr:DNA cytosine methyltransferase [Blastocatellia bacterium]HMZ17408.1 DNA cytosine methyltransferase [Blastocatellia bacterium]HNG29220.1 DNA cytosine methyltransferase [Blastocatellia bacterium]
MLILSLFPGIDLLGRGFEAEGFCVVRGPDPLWGGDIRGFHAPPGRFDGIIGGSPCQDFSVARRGVPPTGEGLELLAEFARVVAEAQPEWWLLENVPTVPDVAVEGYQVHRRALRDNECGGHQARLRHFQFGSKKGWVLNIATVRPSRPPQRAAMATEGHRANRRSFADFCELQGLPRDFDLPGYSREGKYRAVGNGVPLAMARTIARAIREAATAPDVRTFTDARLCACGCGQIVTGKQLSAGPACRKRLEKSRRDPRPIVSSRRITPPGDSQFDVSARA